MTQYKLPEDLFSYQKEDADKMSGLNALGTPNFLCLSEMGTGKTPTSLAVAEYLKAELPLILCPNSLRLEWARQIGDWIGDYLCTVSTNDSYTKLKPMIDHILRYNGRKYNIMNYETLRNKQNIDLLNLIPFDLIICDEVHKLRNPQTKLVRGSQNKDTRVMEGGAWEFFKKHPKSKILCLSGSPIMNYPNDLYVPLTLVNPQKYPPTLPSYRYFEDKYCLFSSGRTGTYVYGYRRLSELREETNPYIIRRTKKEALPFLPEKYYRRVQLKMPPDQRKIYEQMEKELRILLDTGEPLWSPSVLAQLIRLRQLNLDPRIVGVTAESAKTSFLVDLVEGMGDEKLVIFTTFETYAHFLQTVIFKNTKSVSITGQVPPDKRLNLVKEFQEDPETKLCIGTVQTMGEGITLTAASTCVLVDRWWASPANVQCEDRLHRIGAKSAVEVIIPICEDSVDSVLDEILERKGKATREFYQEPDVKRMVMTSRGLI